MSAEAGPTIEPATPETLAAAGRLLREGRLVAFPTETVYGLGADATSDKAVAQIFAAKDRPQFNPLIVHVLDTAAARALVTFTPLAEKLADAFWPGAMTLVLEKRQDCGLSPLVSAGLGTAAIRVPAHTIGQQLLCAAGVPVAAPSANRSGRISPSRADHVAHSLPGPDDGGPALIVDGGACGVGLESTVIDATGAAPVILRHGGIAKEAIEAVVGEVSEASATDETAPRSPGMLARHYAPSKPVRLNALTAEDGEALLAFGPNAPAGALNLSATGDLTEAAAHLFAHLHALDASDATAIAVMPIPETGVGRAINDRLRRATVREEKG